MAAPATQKTRDQAAALIQARVRGHQQRQRDARVLRGVTLLQARQRGRYTRREFQRLLAFYNEQESFLQESRRRQLRLWHREQELYFLQHTTAEELDAIRAFQFERGARRLQRAWRERHPRPLEDVDVSGLGKPFDPFGLGVLADAKRTARGADDREQCAALLNELFGELPRAAPWTVDEKAAAARRAAIQERRRRKEAYAPSVSAPMRRELYEQLVQLRQDTAQKLVETRVQFRAHRGQRDREAARLSASCRQRVAFLLDEKARRVLTGKPNAAQEAARRALESEAGSWRVARQQEAWAHHARAVESVLGARKWYESTLAGERRDIRKVFAQSPWDHERKVWQWPRPEEPAKESNQEEEEDAPLSAMDKFQFCLSGGDDSDAADNQEAHLVDKDEDESGTRRPRPLDDTLASTWWRAHATQSHSSFKRLQDRRLRLLRRTKLLSSGGDASRLDGAEDAHVTPEMLANPRLYALYRNALADAKRKRVEEAVDGKVAQLEHQIRQQVVAVETHVELNTRRILEERARVLQQKARRTKEELAAVAIQRVARGRRGRKQAQDHLATYFVMVRGRAIRKGKCEECGDAPAVLECRQCEESLHFCPTCWVQVHATRRRKAHVAIPMAVAPVAEAPRVGGAKQHEDRGKRHEAKPQSSPPPMRSAAALVLSSARHEEPRQAQPEPPRAITVSGLGQREAEPVALQTRDPPRLEPPLEAVETVRAVQARPKRDAVATEASSAASAVVRTAGPSAFETTVSSGEAPPSRAVAPDAAAESLAQGETEALAPTREAVEPVAEAMKSEPARHKPSSATKAKPTASTKAKPQMSLRERMAAGRQSQQKQPPQDQPALQALVLAAPAEPSTAVEAGTEPSQASVVVAEPVVVDDRAQPPPDRRPDAAADAPPEQERAARKIQSLRRRVQGKQANQTDSTNTAGGTN